MRGNWYAQVDIKINSKVNWRDTYINPLYVTNELFNQVWYNESGMAHCTYEGVTC